MTLARVIVGAGLVAVTVVAPNPVAAQEPERRRGIEVLGLQVSATATADSREQATVPGAPRIPNSDSRYYTDVMAGLRYAPSPRERFSYGASLQSSVRRYETADEFLVLGHSAGGNIAVKAGERLSLSGFGSINYLPSYGLSLAPIDDPVTLASSVAAAGALPASAIDYSLTKRTSVGMGAGGAVQYALARRLSLGMSYSVNRQDFQPVDDPDSATMSAAGRLSYRLHRFLGLKVGFQRRISRVHGQEPLVLDDIDAGLDSGYGRQVNLTKSTTLSFNSGSNITHGSGGSAALALTGGVALAQQIGRRVDLGLGVSRGARLQDGFERPVFSNNVNAFGTVRMRRNLVAEFSANGSVGRSQGLAAADAAADADDVLSYAASARLSYTFLGRGQAYGQYLFSGHTIGESVGILEGVTRDYGNRSARIGVTWSIALLTVRAGR